MVVVIITVIRLTGEVNSTELHLLVLLDLFKAVVLINEICLVLAVGVRVVVLNKGLGVFNRGKLSIISVRVVLCHGL